MKSSALIPRYQRVRQAIQQDIEEGRLTPGDMLPSEASLCTEHGVSSITIRRALRELAQDGLIHRVNGVGTFVSVPRRRFSIALLFLGFEEYEWRMQGRMFGSLIGGVGEVVWENGSLLSVMHTSSEEDVTAVLEQITSDEEFHGVLLRTSDDPPADVADTLSSLKLPHVFIKKRVAGRRTNSVLFDNMNSARLATDHLLDIGHERIACVLGRRTSTFNTRANGYRKALERRSMPVHEEYLRHGRNEFAEAGFEETHALLNLESPPTSIIVAADHMTQGVYRAIRERGLRIGHDITLVAFDEIDLAKHFDPPLTTIGPTDYEIGRESVRLLVDQLEGSITVPREVTLEPVLNVQHS